MNCLTSLCRYTASRRPDVLGAMRGLFFWPAARATQAAPHLRRPIRELFFQHTNRVICRPPALLQVLPPTRHYCTFPHRPVTHFTPTRYSRWYYDPRKVAVAMVPLIGIGVAVVPDYGYLETVPFTNRTHFVHCSPLEEREHHETHFAQLKEKYASIILDPHHPDCVRLNNITSKIVRVVSSHLVTESHNTVMLHRGTTGSTMEVLRTKLVSARRAQPATGHLDGLNWEVMVVKDEQVTIWCYPAGKIIVPTALLQVFKTDAELAAMVAHEFGHIVARHWAEKIIYKKWFLRPLRVPCFRRVEREADQIGMMLLAAAGFDPRVAPSAFEKLGDSIRDLPTHRSIKKRSQLLSRSKIMREALELYREVSPDQDAEGSL